jgi:hypothetical protein
MDRAFCVGCVAWTGATNPRSPLCDTIANSRGHAGNVVANSCSYQVLWRDTYVNAAHIDTEAVYEYACTYIYIYTYA